jgi:class 3 adenylate cyclase
MLPRSVAHALREGRQVAGDSFPAVSVLFCDIVDFTGIAAHHSPLEIFDLLRTLYTRFDELIERHPVYKVETVGDCYVVAAGVPDPDPAHADTIVAAGLDMLEVAGRVALPGGDPVQVRIGINSGPVVAGVVGTKMPRYCLYGDTVNIASRMETTCEPGHVQISERTWEFLYRARWRLSERGEVELKGKGRMRTHFVARP